MLIWQNRKKERDNMRKEPLAKTLTRHKNALILKEKNPYEIEDELRSVLEEMHFENSEEKQKYLPLLFKRLDTICLYPEQEFSKLLEEFLEDVRYQLNAHSWEQLIWKWEEEEYRQLFIEAVLEQMEIMKLPLYLKKAWMPRIMEAYETVIQQDPMYPFVIHRKPISENNWIEELEQTTKEEREVLEQNREFLVGILATNLFFSIHPDQVAECFSNEIFDEKLREEIIKKLS